MSSLYFSSCFIICPTYHYHVLIMNSFIQVSWFQKSFQSAVKLQAISYYIMTMTKLFGDITTSMSDIVNQYNIYGHSGLNLQSVNDILENDFKKRKYNVLRLRMPESSSPSSIIPLYLHLLYPLEYWRIWTIWKRKHYNMLIQRPSNDKHNRLLINAADYWESEIRFWRLVWISRREYTELGLTNYWKSETLRWKT